MRCVLFHPIERAVSFFFLEKLGSICSLIFWITFLTKREREEETGMRKEVKKD